MTWDPAQYLKYASERLRPALDLMARIGVAAPGSIVDLGCGAGNVTRILADRWPGAKLTGVDNSAAMLARARDAIPDATRIAWVEDDLARWAATSAPMSVDVVYSNAALHWLTGMRACSRASWPSSPPAARSRFRCRRISRRRRTFC